MHKRFKKLFLLPILGLILSGCDIIDEVIDEILEDDDQSQITQTIVENEAYDSAQDVVDYLDIYGELPPNYLTKKEAKELGWDASEGNLWEVAPDASIGGDYFGNFEGLLPDADDRNYYEADIDYDGGYRNAQRLIYSDDELYFYTEDHYETFEEMKPSGEN